MSTLPKLDLPSLRKKEQPPRPRFLALVDLDGAVVSAIRRPLWAVSMWVAAAFAVLPPAAFLVNAARHEGVAAAMTGELKKSGQFDKLQPEQREKIETVVAPILTVAFPVGAAAKRQMWIGYCALVCFAFLRGTRPQVTLRRAVAVACVGAAPWYAHDVVSAVTLLVYDSGGIDPQNPVASNLTAWLFSGKDTRTPLAVLLRGLDFFELWGCFWMTRALTQLAGGRTGVPAVVVFGGAAAFLLKDVLSALATSSL